MFERIIRFLGGATLVIMMLHVSVSVVAKTLFHVALIGTLEIVAYIYMVIVIFLPLMLIQWQRKHISVDLFTQNVTPRVSRVLDVFADLLTIVYFGCIAYTGYRLAVYKTSVGESVDLVFAELAIWPMRWFLALSCAAVVVVTVIQMIRGPGANAAAAPAEGGPS